MQRVQNETKPEHLSLTIKKKALLRLNTHHTRCNTHGHQFLEEEFAGVGHSNQRYLQRDCKSLVINTHIASTSTSSTQITSLSFWLKSKSEVMHESI